MIKLYILVLCFFGHIMARSYQGYFHRANHKLGHFGHGNYIEHHRSFIPPDIEKQASPYDQWHADWLRSHNDCGDQKILPVLSNRWRIVGGNEAVSGSWPWMAFLRINLPQMHQIYCAATLIDKDWVMTAAHCFSMKSFAGFLLNSNQNGNTDERSLEEPGLWTVYLGRNNAIDSETEETQQSREVEKVIIHPKHDQFDNDIALIKLKSSVDFTDYILPVCMDPPQLEMLPGERCIVTGYGIHNETGKKETFVLRQTELPLLPPDACSYGGAMTDNMLCVGYMEGGTDACNFDSGGPLQCKYNNKWFQTGIVSSGFNDPCGSPGKPGVYTKLSNYQEWIPLTIHDYLN